MDSFLPTSILQLSITERIQLVQDLWDSIAAASDDLALTDAQRQELDRRLELYQQNPLAGSTWEEVKQRLNNLT